MPQLATKLLVCAVLLCLSCYACVAESPTPPNTCSGWVDGVTCQVGRGIIQDSALNLTEIVWVGPENKKVYVGSPAVVQVPNTDTYLSSHDFFFNTLDVTVQVFKSSRSQGVGEWVYAGNVSGMYWANLFSHGPYIYMMGVSAGDDDNNRSIAITRTKTLGETWEAPSILFPAKSRHGTFYHCAPTPTILGSDGRFYRAYEVHEGYVGALIIFTRNPVNDTTNLMDPLSWQMSSIETFSSDMVPTDWDQQTNWGWQEGNAVEMDGNVYDILRIDGQTKKTNNKAALLKLDPQTNILKFQEMINFPSTDSKFTIRRDQKSGDFFTLSNNVTAEAISLGTVYARNNLILARSKDLLHWHVCKTLLRDDSGFDPLDSARFTGFNYVDWIFSGEDILYAIRSGYRGSNTFHNANRLTVKREYGFRNACRL